MELLRIGPRIYEPAGQPLISSDFTPFRLPKEVSLVQEAALGLCVDGHPRGAPPGTTRRPADQCGEVKQRNYKKRMGFNGILGLWWGGGG